MLSHFFRSIGFEEPTCIAHAINFSAGTENNYAYTKDFEVAFTLLRPFMLKMNVCTKVEFGELHRKALIEMRQDSFCGLWTFLSMWEIMPDWKLSVNP